MKRFFYHFLILLVFLLVSCQKEELEPQTTPQTNDSKTDTVSLYGKYTLLSGKMYVDNMETYQKTVYNHFSGSKTTSSLRYGGSLFPFEDIMQNVTTWEIIGPKTPSGHGEFILNNDLNDPYGFYITRSNWSIVEHPLTNTNGITQKLGGSARPISGYLLNKIDSTVIFRIQTGTGNINGYNCRYFSELKFKKLK